MESYLAHLRELAKDGVQSDGLGKLQVATPDPPIELEDQQQTSQHRFQVARRTWQKAAEAHNEAGKRSEAAANELQKSMRRVHELKQKAVEAKGVDEAAQKVDDSIDALQVAQQDGTAERQKLETDQ